MMAFSMHLLGKKKQLNSISHFETDRKIFAAGFHFGVNAMQLFLTTFLHLEEQHPRDRVWFDVYTNQQAAKEVISEEVNSELAAQLRILTMTLPLEQTYQSHSQTKLLSLPIDSLEARTVQALRERAHSASATPLIHAYRCLATCLDNYARYGGENAVARVLALAYRLSLQHSSKPYRAAFNQAYSDLSKLVACHEANHVVSERPAYAPPERVFYTLILRTSSTPLPPVHIRLFQRKEDAVLHLTDMLREYGIPFEVWRSLRSAMADETLPYVQDSLFFSMGEKKVIT